MNKAIVISKSTNIPVDKKLIKWGLGWLFGNKLGFYIVKTLMYIVKRVFTTEVISYEEAKRRGLVVLSSNIPK
jgi:hypothetical protein